MYVLGYTGYTRDTRLANGHRSHFAKTNQDFDSIFEFRDGEVPFTMFPLGYFGHDASAALLSDGKVIACASEERFTRIKHSLNLAGNTLLPRRSIEFCLDSAGISISDVDMVAHYCNFTPDTLCRRIEHLRPFLSRTEMESVEKSFSQIFDQMMSQDAVTDQFRRMTGSSPKRFVPVRHHLAHAASAFYPSGFSEALICTIDGTGECESGMMAVGRETAMQELRSIVLPTSLGALYLVVTMYLGFKSLGDEYKVMGLASYGDASRFRRAFEELVLLHALGVYETPLLSMGDLKGFLLSRLGPARRRGDPVEPRHADIAAALQESLHRAVMHSLEHAQRETGLRNLCLAGGVALNCTLNGVIARSGLFERIFVQPASSDEGCSVGAALTAFHHLHPNGARRDSAWTHAYWGPSFGDESVRRALETHADSITWRKEKDICRRVAVDLANGKVVGWFQGRMEFGPRALGNRSILADPRDGTMKDRINEKVKRREPFRPFAPAVLAERAAEYFDMSGLDGSPFMLFTVPVNASKRETIPAVTHVDGTARLQTVSKETNPRFYDLIDAFGGMTGVPIVLNTSFNVKNEPIVCTPEDALSCFLSTDIDSLGIGDYFVTKKVSV